jgi:SAM-dependent methyltransferase
VFQHHQDRRRAHSFGEDPETYHRERPSYPRALIDELMAGEPHRVLDVGCGTGKAGSLLAARGCTVLGVEPDERMAAVARRHGLEVELAKFEEWDPAGRRYDRVVSGQAWHWVDPAGGARAAAAALRRGGRLAVFGNRSTYDPETQAAIDDVYGRLAPQMLEESGSPVIPRSDPYPLHADAIAAGGRFEPPRSFTYPWTQEYPRERWLELLSTHSNHRVLPDEERAALLAAVGEVVDRLGGSIRLEYHTVLSCWTRR